MHEGLKKILTNLKMPGWSDKVKPGFYLLLFQRNQGVISHKHMGLTQKNEDRWVSVTTTGSQMTL